MSQQEVMYGQISQQMHSSEAPKEGDFLPQPVQRPPEYVGFVPFHQQQGQQRHPEPRQLEPSLSLSLERPDAYGNVQFQQQQGGPLRPVPARPFEVRPSNAHPFDVRQDAFRSFNLEQQPFQHTEQPNHPSYNTNHGNIPVAHQTHHGMDSEHDAAAHMIPTHNGGGSSEQADDGMHLQIVPASEFLPHDQGGHQQHYPPPSASHDAVIQDPELFMTTLDNFLAALGTRLTVPKVGGKEMNLHAFYCEVTARGGLEQVIRSAQWKELSEVLDVPRPSVSTSFVLRKHYTSLLFHYEQVYYFSAEGKLLSPPVPLPAPSPVEPAADIGSPYEVPPEIGSVLKKRKRKLDPMQVFGVDPAASIGTIATGAINGKFDEGYFVTVVVGTEKLTGVLYHLSAGKNVPQFASVPSLLDGIGSDGNTPGLEIQLYGKKRKERVRKRDPNAPKRTRTGYNIFFKEQRARLKQLYPETKGHGKKVIEMWSQLPENQKSLYVARGNQEREKYLTEYREKMRLQSQVSDGANVAAAAGGQPVGEHDHGTYDVSHDYHVSLDVESDIQSGHPHVSEMDHVYHGYHANGPQPHLPESEKSGGHLVSEQAYEVQEDEGDYPQEPVSEEEDEEEEEEEDDAELEDAYEGEEDETVYPGSEKIFEGQDGSEYQVSDRDYNMPEGAYPLQANESRTYESRVHSASVNPKQPYYGQDHTYTYAPTLPQQGEGSVGSARMASLGQVPYQMQDNGQVIYPHLQQGRPEASVDNTMSQQHYLTQDRYVYPHARQGQTEEALGLPVTQDQGSFRRQDEGSSYLAPFHQNQAMGSNIQTRQVPSEQAYQDRYAYPIHMPYAQMYTRPPHAYPPRFPYPPYPMQLSETQALHYGHAYAAQVHQPQASIPDVSGVGAPLQVYQTQDGGHAYHAQDGNPVPVFKHNSNK